jgi:hypothetical protein
LSKLYNEQRKKANDEVEKYLKIIYQTWQTDIRK